MKPLTEAEFRQLVSQQPPVITRYQITSSKDYGSGWYFLIIHTTGRKRYVLVSMRGSARRWANLNNLVSTLTEFFVEDAEIVLKLNVKGGVVVDLVEKRKQPVRVKAPVASIEPARTPSVAVQGSNDVKKAPAAKKPVKAPVKGVAGSEPRKSVKSKA